MRARTLPVSAQQESFLVIKGRQPSRSLFLSTMWPSRVYHVQDQLKCDFHVDSSEFTKTPSHAIVRLPVLLHVECPLELQMCDVVVVDELGDGLVVAAAYHARGCGLGLDCAGVSAAVS